MSIEAQNDLDALVDGLCDLSLYEALLERYENGGLWHFERDLRTFVGMRSGGWQLIFPLPEKLLFHRRASFAMVDAGRRGYYRRRFRQLLDGSANLWVYICGSACRECGRHTELSGLVLHRDHPFWRRFMPPNDWRCDCSVYAASSERAAIRLGGDPGRTLPRCVEDADWLAEQLDPDFDGVHYPDVRASLVAVASGRFDV
ncbi:MAG: hypothetical protein ACOY5U_02300 [Pseudomonadota bacterium]